ncbi:MAG: sigma-70 family RNA polymerase sigma factor [Reyranella sp.]|uniref:sigma-70 family RNA polymerase sigma factor n=1 Tax=Reyranella sp. TaxID=1929291 RepID=UPI001AC01482|nr:sigma-70 family RNA polymerase sigma factor [Reyranella sp.]MBN9090426.1 sigma-70 family RNA polymerase sigma factor [Reyranella sp.]
MTDPKDLSALMQLARQGDDEAYRRLLGQVSIWLRGVVRGGLIGAGRGTADCEDVVQETLLAMHLKRDTWDDGQPLEPWLRAIARHKLVDYLRRRGFRDHVDIDDYVNSPEAAVTADASMTMDSRRLLATLPERQRRIVEEISLEGRQAADVAVHLGMSEGAVRVSLHRALKALAASYRRDRA